MAKDEAADKAEAPKKKDKKKLIMIVVGIVVLGAAYKFVLAPKPAPASPAAAAAASAAATAIPTGPPGIVVTLDPVNINLAGDGHYLKLGFSLQMSKAAGATIPEGAFAMDAAIRIFTNQSVQTLSNGKQVEKLKHELLTEIEEYYEYKVQAIYFTSFVTQ
ncbi:flagellar FliL protein [Motilibacter rhizosphaerae]|uniref:Flagellar protein FliL n=1 Tax=Motilibacter rhizosphaerae TaxID=598652 RepID=A0A4Q7NW55_9ACTN|nr:flagellar basal body-associated FliL family protein [Motilibacter rhizosphaerae]RZS91435.1 flagellar FliL protein [Motilibacter rhizosphaerae]